MTGNGGRRQRQPATRGRRGLLSSPAATRTAFVVIIVFVTAQMAWWIYFQAGYVGEVNEATMRSLGREARAIDALLAMGAEEQARELLEGHPLLRLSADGSATEAREDALATFAAEQRSAVRMLAFEGPFFVLVVMLGLLIIGRNLRLERELKLRQSNFLDAVGHEYKTPISTLRLALDTLSARTVSPEKQQEYLRAMSRDVDRLERTGQQVLATARLEFGERNATAEPGDLKDLVRAALAQVRPVYAARGATIEYVETTEPLPMQAGPDDIATIVENLVDNAVKYSGGLEKWVGVEVERNGRWARLSVADHGDGIAAASQAKVFDRFYREGSELTRSTPGLGLGLYLVKRTVAALGGRVRLASKPGEGTVVTAELPLYLGEQP